MIKPVVFTLAVLIATPVYAIEGFYKAADFASAPAVQKASKAVPKLQEIGNSCSGAFISPDGYFLTAMHCLKFCLEHKQLADYEVGSYPKFKITKPKSQQPDVVCETAKIEKLGLSAPKIILLGKGYSLFDEAYLPYYDTDVQGKFQDTFEDFVIVKFNVKTPATCLPLKESAAAPGEYVYSIGYPGPATRSNGKSSDGDGQKITQGNVLDGIASSDAIRSIRLLQGEKITNDQLVERLSSVIDANGAMTLDNDNYPGMSGGPIVNKQGQLVGLTFAGVGASEAVMRTRYIKGTSLGFSIKKIKSIVDAKLGVQKSNQIFNCGRAQ